MTPTDEQMAVADAARQQPESLLVRAYAGCAKTTTLTLAGKGIKVPALALAFNKRNAEDLKPRFAGNFAVRTLNGLGHLAWARGNLQVTKWELDDRKLGKLVTQVVRDRQVALAEGQWQTLRGLVSRAQVCGLVPEGLGAEGLVPDSSEGWKAVADEAGVDEEDFGYLWELAREVLQLDIELARKGVISFDDQIYCSAMLGGAFPKYPVVLTDETQDLAPLNFVMLAKSLRPDGRLVAVGDERQAIYAFRGAAGDAMQLARGLRPSWLELPLTLTFRCPKVVVERQQGHAPGFRAAEGNRPGKVVRRCFEPEDVEFGEGWSWGEMEALRPPGGTLAVLCRNNGPLLGLAFRLLRQGVPCHVLGRDILQGLVALVKKLAPERASTAELLEKLAVWVEHEVGLAVANGNKVEQVFDKAEAIRASIEGAEARTVGELLAGLQVLFARTEGRVTLASVHKAKGGEWDMVLHLDPWRIPSRRAQGEVAMRQERNLGYVCETRTRDVLVLASLGDMRRGG